MTDDLLSVVMGTGDDEASRLAREVRDDTARRMDEALCRQLVHGEQPCNCTGDKCVGIVFFGGIP